MARNRNISKEHKRIGRIEDSKRSIFGNKDLTPYNVGKKTISYK